MSRGDKEAEDLLQETFLRALTNKSKLDSLQDYQQRAWLFRVLRNLAYDSRRRQRAVVQMLEDYEPILDFQSQTHLELEELLDTLPGKLRDIVYKRFWLGMNSKQIAQLMGVPDATVRYRLRTAMEMLRSQIRKE